MYSVKQVIKDALSKFWTGYKKNVVDNLTSKNANLPLSANMGRELNSKLNDYVTVKTFGEDVTLSQGGAIIKFKETALSGYTAIGIVQCSFNTTWMSIDGMYIESNGQIPTVVVRDIGKPSSSTTNIKCYIKILYVKN